MKRVAVALLVTLAACGGSSSSTEPTAVPPNGAYGLRTIDGQRLPVNGIAAETLYVSISNKDQDRYFGTYIRKTWAVGSSAPSVSSPLTINVDPSGYPPCGNVPGCNLDFVRGNPTDLARGAYRNNTMTVDWGASYPGGGRVWEYGR